MALENNKTSDSIVSMLCGICAMLLELLRRWLFSINDDFYIWISVIAVLLAVAGIVFGIIAFRRRRIFCGLVLAVPSLVLCLLPLFGALFWTIAQAHQFG